ncbi:MAG: metallophosphoesterase, partial [Elusimicrobiota bacterium]|nr:metallophosphoesterase [Elusimicrobiota bacterium]
DTGFLYLDGNYAKIKLEAGTIGIVGLGLEDYSDRRLLSGILAKMGKTDATVLLCHVPDALKTAEELPINALFSGHTHGGQVCLPWFGPIVTLSHVARKIAAGGIHRVGGLYVIVSRGLGMEGHIAPRVRTFCRPHLILLELTPA